MLFSFGDDDFKPAAVLLTHVFALGDQRLRLMTLLYLTEGAPAPELLEAVFGAGAHVALSSPEERAFTDVSLGDSSVDSAALAAWPAPTRAALRAALRTQ